MVPKRALWMYSPGAISLSASRFLFSSVTAVRLPAGTDLAGRVVSTMSPPAMESFSVVPAGTVWAETKTVRGCAEATARWSAPLA